MVIAKLVGDHASRTKFIKSCQLVLSVNRSISGERIASAGFQLAGRVAMEEAAKLKAAST